MRKAILCAVLISILFVSTSSYAFVQSSFVEGSMKKLGRGAANIVSCPLEIVECVSKANVESGPIAAITYGVIRGFYRTGLRLAVGAYEVVTFPIPIPADYEPILDDPEFFLFDGLF